jgi:RNA polymerase sigma-70 factor (ECF subfamily)
MSDEMIHNAPPGGYRFATTHWSVVLAAGRSSAADYREALTSLCQTYWFPLYAFLRREGYDTHQAEDYIQGFFTRMLEKQDLKQVDPRRGKFRSFLLTSLKHFVANQRAMAGAKKRGGDQKGFSLDLENAERQYDIQAARQLSPQKIYERSWALTVLERTLNRLKEDSVQSGKEQLFDHLKGYITAKKESVPYRDAAAELEMNEATVRVAVHRLRRRYRDLLREEIAQTVTSEEQIDEEIRDLFAALV